MSSTAIVRVTDLPNCLDSLSMVVCRFTGSPVSGPLPPEEARSLCKAINLTRTCYRRARFI